MMNRSKITLVRPPFYSVFGTEQKVGNIPLGLCYIASVLEGEGYRVDVLDCETLNFGERADVGKLKLAHQMILQYSRYEEIFGDENHPIWKKIAEEILDNDPDLIGFTTLTMGMSSVIYVSKILKRETATPIILGGSHPTVKPELSLRETGADVIVIGEGERTIVELAPALLEGSKLNEVRGIAYIENSECFINERRERIKNLDQIPFPARHLLRRSDYKSEAFGYIISSRGCPYNCLFCASRTIWGRQPTFRSVENVLDEIEHVCSTYGTRQFRFADDMFTLNRDRVLRFCRRLRERGLEILFRATSRTDTVDREVLYALRSAGCNRISFGVESGSQRILDLIGKRTTVEKSREAIKLSKEAGLNTIATFIVGHPTETLDDIQATIDLIDDIHPSRTTMNLMTVLPGTALWKEDQTREWWRYFFQGKSVRSVSSLSDEKLNEVYKEISAWVMKKNMGEAGRLCL
jgi:radical SAM superfamily enzyme YgiQ (UPF0313 family)